MDFIWQLKGVNMCLDSEVPLDNGYKMFATVSSGFQRLAFKKSVFKQ